MKFFLPILLMPLMACVGQDVDPDVTLSVHTSVGPSQTQGVIWAQHTLGAPSATIHAQFLKTQGIDAETALGALDIWRPDTELALDACQVGSPPVFGDGIETTIELLDVGSLHVEAPFGVAHIKSRQLPDLGHVSGVIYANAEGYGVAAVDVPYAHGATYTWRASGAEIGPFDVEVIAPQTPIILTTDTSDLAKQGLWVTDFELRWETPEDPSLTELYLDLEGEGVTLSCRLEDDGAFALGPALMEPLRATGSGASLMLRRVVRQPVIVPGVDHAEVVFAAADSLFLFW